MRFDGKAFANEIEERVRVAVGKMAQPPRVVSVLVGDDPASELYTRLKREAAERVGIQFEVVRVEAGAEIKDKMGQVSQSADGVMVQLPIPGLSKEEEREVLSRIPLDKDIDGLRYPVSGVMPATVRAILTILERIDQDNPIWTKQFTVVGDRGNVGGPLVSELKKRGVVVNGVNSKTEGTELARRLLAGEVVVSCVGRSGLISKEMISEGVILIDVGISRVNGKVVGDMTPEAYEKAKVSVRVPGGVGPVTVATLLSNVVECLGYKINI